MNYTHFFIIAIAMLLLSLMALASCKSVSKKGNTEGENAQAPPKGKVLALIQLSKGSCYGKCPTFDCYIAESGLVRYNGKQNVKREGGHSGNLTKAELRAARALFDNSDFKELNDAYLSQMTDLPRITLAYQDKKIVFHHPKAPESLLAIMKGLDAIIDGADLKEQK